MELKKVRKTGVCWLMLFTIFVEIMGINSKTVFAQSQIIEKEAEQQTKSLKKAADGIVDSTGNYEYTVNEDGTATILSYKKDAKKVEIPSTLDGYSVTVIGKDAFYGKVSTTAIKIPETVTEIGEYAFEMSGIKTITILESVLKIGKYAFYCCNNLETIFIPKNVKEMGIGITFMSRNLIQIEVDSRNTVYTSVDGILYSKDMTKLLTVPEGKDIADFRFPDSVVYIESYAIAQNDSLTELVIPDQIIFLGKLVFYDCRNLKSVVIGKNITWIDDAAFSVCTKLSRVVINGRLKSIGEEAFMDCFALSEINIPDSVTEIGRWAFYNCGSLQSFTIPKSVTKIGDRAIGYSEDCEERMEGVYIIGYADTAAQSYAKEFRVMFQNAETDEVIRYDLVSVPGEKLKTLTAGKKKIKLTYKAVEEAAYRIAVKKVGSTTWKKYDASKTSAVIKGLKSGKKYKVKVRALRKIDGKYYYGNWSTVKKITVK